MSEIDAIKQKIEVQRWKLGSAEKLVVADATGTVAYVVTRGFTSEGVFVSILGIVIAILLGMVIVKEYRTGEDLIKKLGRLIHERSLYCSCHPEFHGCPWLALSETPTHR